MKPHQKHITSFAVRVILATYISNNFQCVDNAGVSNLGTDRDWMRLFEFQLSDKFSANSRLTLELADIKFCKYFILKRTIIRINFFSSNEALLRLQLPCAIDTPSNYIGEDEIFSLNFLLRVGREEERFFW